MINDITVDEHLINTFLKIKKISHLITHCIRIGIEIVKIIFFHFIVFFFKLSTPILITLILLILVQNNFFCIVC